MISIPIATQLSDGDLMSAVMRLVAEGRHRTADLIALLVALEKRTVHVEAGFTSLFRFCVGRLRLSEEEAFYRIAASRVAARFPVVLERLREGRLTLTAVALLRKHLTDANHLKLLDDAEYRSKREIQALVARLAPRPDVPVSIRKLAPPRTLGRSMDAAADAAVGPLPILDAARTAADLPVDLVPVLDAGQPPRAAGTSPRLPDVRAASPTPGPSALAASSGGGGAPCAPAFSFRCSVPPPPAAVMTPLAPGRYSLRLTISEETHAKLRRAQDLLAHTVPAGDTAAVLDRALTILVAQLERQKYAALCERPKERVSPAASRRAARPTPAAADAATAREPPPARSTVPTSPAAPLVAAAGAAPKEASRRRSRYIPAAVRREVWQREGGRCGYVAPDGNRCAETARLEFHHTIPVADGGAATASTVVLRCVRHHTFETRRWFGEEVTAYRGKGPREGTPGARGHPGWP